MPKSTTPRRKGRGAVVQPLTWFDRVDDLLKLQLATFPSKTELTEEEIERWHRDLEKYPIEAIDWAFDNHRRLSRFFPVPSDILDQLRTWEPEQKYVDGCSRECQKRHGKGYGTNDMVWLAEAYVMASKRLNRKALTDVEWEELLDQLDKKRGESPEWRKKTA